MKGCLKFAVIVVLGFFGLAVVMAIVGDGGKPRAPRARVESSYVAVGQVGELRTDDPERLASVYLSRSPEVYDEYIKFVAAKDLDGISTLILTRRIVTLPHGTKARVIERSASRVRVRVADGPNRGADGWVIADFVRPAG